MSDSQWLSYMRHQEGFAEEAVLTYKGRRPHNSVARRTSPECDMRYNVRERCLISI